MAQMQLGGQQNGQSAWHHVSSEVGGMGQQVAGANGAIATKMTGGRRRQSKSRRDRQSRKVDRKQRRQGQRRQRQSRKQRGGRR